MTDFHTEPHTMTRIDINTGVPFDTFVTAFEQAAPAFDPLPTQRTVERGGDWDDVRAEVAMVYCDSDRHAVSTMDKPSTAFGSLGVAEVTAVGEASTVRWRTCCASSASTPSMRSPDPEWV
jgi:predicted RNA-binding protein (virulence factor B family)